MDKVELSAKEVKKIALNILVKFAEYCEKNNLTYVLAGGTLLGAIRHKGFIPWDDDIDVMMPRDDFEKFNRLVKNAKLGDNIGVLQQDSSNYYYPFTKLYDDRTIAKMDDNNSVHGVWIDIFPADNIPADVSQTKKLFRKSRFWRATIISMNTDLKNSRGYIKNIAKVALKVLSNMVGKKRVLKLATANAMTKSNENSEFIGGVLWGYGVKEKLKKEEFINTTSVVFEGYEFKAPVGWDKYLTGLYGNYMELPPVDKRQTHHITAYYK